MNSNRHSSPAAPANAGTFDDVVLPHLDAAYRLARWLMRNEHDVDDVVQEASLRAFQYFRTFAGGNGRAWFLRIVRNTCWGWHGHAPHGRIDTFDEQQHSRPGASFDPEILLLQTDDAALIARALRNLPDRLHQLIVLRELEGLSYRELAEVVGIPIGTVMSRLSRAREALRSALDAEMNQPKALSTPSSGAKTTGSSRVNPGWLEYSTTSPG
jgi:RNA polymerase sigma-70 factor, ECF subfamily